MTDEFIFAQFAIAHPAKDSLSYFAPCHWVHPDDQADLVGVKQLWVPDQRLTYTSSGTGWFGVWVTRPFWQAGLVVEQAAADCRCQREGMPVSKY